MLHCHFFSNTIKALIFRNSDLVKGEGFGFVSIFRNQMLKQKHSGIKMWLNVNFWITGLHLNF